MDHWRWERSTAAVVVAVVVGLAAVVAGVVLDSQVPIAYRIATGVVMPTTEHLDHSEREPAA